uniref:Putative 5'-3' exonuclease n=1 Tax=Ixodes ricinus TaxID=34613 RepID=A0A6B0VEV0_IXORI
MGVQGLWQILEPAGKPVALETLESKVLAVDISMWLHQALKGMRDSEGGPAANAHLVALFHRACKLLFYGVKPVFVFDGGVPQLKKQTLAARHQRRAAMLADAQRKARLRLLTSRRNAHSSVRNPQVEGDIFALPPLPPHWSKIYGEQEDEELSWSKPGIGLSPRELSLMDFDSEEFEELPAELRHEALRAMQHQQRWGRKKQLPKDSEAFSNYQLTQLMRKRRLESKANEARREMLRPEGLPLAEVYSVASEKGLRSLLHPLEQGTPQQRTTSAPLASNDGGVAEPNPTTREQPKPEEDMQVPQPNTSASSDNAAVLQWLQEQTQRGSPDKRQDHASSESTVAANEDLQPGSSKQLTQPVQRHQVAPPHQPSVERSQEADAASEASLEDDMIAAAVTESLLEDARVRKDVVLERTESGVDDSVETSDHGGDVSPTTDVLDTEVCDKTPPADSWEVSDGEEEGACYSSDSRPPSEAEESAQQAEEVTEHEPVQERPDVASTSQERGPTTEQSWKPLQLLPEEELKELENQERKQQRQATGMSDQLVTECQELLRMFGLPFVVSPGEAEAQCAWLEEQGLTQGTVTDDSDAWLFGARTVYRHLFASDRRPSVYRLQDLATQLGLNRQKLVAFALLCGSDYTAGVSGVGPITAMEVLSEFSGEDALQLLENFRTWLERAKSEKVHPGNRTRSHLVRLTVEPGFPSAPVVRAYLEPSVDASKETFSWGTPNLDELRSFGQRKLGWQREKLDDLLLPVLRRMGEKQSQTRMDQYLHVLQSPRKPKLFPSKRLCKALGKMADDPVYKAESEPQLSEESD